MSHPTEQHHIKVERTARFYASGTHASNADQFWTLIHGYGQLGNEMIDTLQPLMGEHTLMVAPEALSRFYLKSGTDRVGASWMTKEDRLNEIVDYVAYLDAVAFQYFTQIPHNAERHVLGFSQGCATMCRWLAQRKPDVNHVWICSGSLPHDLNWPAFTEYMKGRQLHILVGDEDKWITQDGIDAAKALLEEHDLDFDLHVFNGGHVIHIETIKSILGVKS